MNPTCRARHDARADSPTFPISVPETSIGPDEGLSMPAMRLRSVVFPEPEGPMSPRNSPSGISNEMSRRTGISYESRQYDFETFWIETRAMADYSGIGYSLTFTLFPDCRSGGGFRTTRSPWESPSFTSANRPKVGPSETGAAETASFLRMNATFLPSRVVIAAVSTARRGFDEAASAVPRPRKWTLALISGSTRLSRSRKRIFVRTVAFARSAVGTILSTIAL